jgi:competence protein ComEA
VVNEPDKRRNRICSLLPCKLRRHRNDELPHRADARRSLFTAGDQRVIAVLVSLALVVMATSWLTSGGLSGGLVDIDTAEPLHATFQCDVNSADWIELMQLPEIGESLARRIVESRERDGPFRSLGDLDRVPGIGPKTLEKIRPYLQPID